MVVIGVIAVLVVTCVATDATADGVREIPLSEVWAVGMPGTRLIGFACDQDGSPDPECVDAVRSIDLTLRTLTRVALQAEQALPVRAGIAVGGSARKAVIELASVLDGGGESEDIRAGSPVFLVVFAPANVRDFRLTKVRFAGLNKFELYCQFSPRLTRNYTAHFAVIPVGVLPQGEYEVLMKHDRLPASSIVPDLDSLDALSMMSASFSFAVFAGDVPRSRRRE